MTTDRLSQLPNRNVLTYRSGSCLLASKIIKKYRKQNITFAKDSTQQLEYLQDDTIELEYLKLLQLARNEICKSGSFCYLVWLAYLKFFDTFSKELREHAVNNRIHAITQNDIKFVYKSRMRKYLG